MHHYIYPAKDTYITNRSGYSDKNFGIDEILQIGTSNVTVSELSQTREYEYTNQIFTSTRVQNFTGTFTGSLLGSASFASGSISGSNLWFSSSNFTGSVNGSPVEISGSISGSLVNGGIYGTLIMPYAIGIFNGQLTSSNGCFSGTGSGVDTRVEPHWTTTTGQYVDRALIAFSISQISKSIASGDIVNPKWFLNIKVCNEYQLPLNYTIYAAPISQSWVMGNGYNSDGGSDTGVTWEHREGTDGPSWYLPIVTGTRNTIDFMSDPTMTTASWGFQGGTWFTESYCSQSFGYQSADIQMDVTPIINKWLNRTIPNNGFILFSSDELLATGSGFTLKFFSHETNTIYAPYLDVAWNDSTFTTGSISTSSINISHAASGISSSISNGSFITVSGGISGSFSGSAVLIFTQNYSASVLLSDLSSSGFTVSEGLSGNINGIPVIGGVVGVVSVSESMVTGPCGKTFNTQLASGSFIDGVFSGSTFTAYYVENKFENGFLTGSWTSASLSGLTVNIPIPSGIEPYSYAYVSGTYVNGTAIGTYSNSGSTSASFSGQFINGNLLGANLSLQLTGSVITSSYYYTSSVELTSSVFANLDIERPFSVIVQNLQSTYRTGDIPKISVFARKKYPQKYFGRSPQQEQYMYPEVLPTSSFYALKDNQTDEIVMNFDSYTQISCEYPNGNYFYLDTTGLQPERYYRVLIQVLDDNSSYTIDTGKAFKLVRGDSKTSQSWPPQGIPETFDI